MLCRPDAEFGLEQPFELAHRHAEPPGYGGNFIGAVGSPLHLGHGLEHQIVADAGAQPQLQALAVGRRLDAVMNEPLRHLARKVAAMVAYFKEAPPADAAWAVFFLTGRRLKRLVSYPAIHAWTLAATGLESWLLEESYAVVGDGAETAALVLDQVAVVSSEDVPLSEWVEGRILPLRELDEVHATYRQYLSRPDTYGKTGPGSALKKPVAYFSAEFGFHESIPNYSGGLGILSGDHCKSASDLDLNFVAVGLLYRHGYFKQQIDGEGGQEAVNLNQNFHHLPIREVRRDNARVLIAVRILDRNVLAKIWELHVGRINLYLLDTDVAENTPEDRLITAEL